MAQQVRPCFLKGVVCTASSEPHVARLLLGSNNLTESIPAEIGDLPYLEEIMFTGNKLTGTLPPELGNLPALARLKVNANVDLGGEIPTAIYTGLKDTLTQFSIGGAPGGVGTARCHTVPSGAPAGMVPWLDLMSGGQWDADC